MEQITSEDEFKENYAEFIEKQQRGYEITAAMLGYTVKRMQEEGLISQNVNITGRIKSPKSAFENSSKKAIDDCFGIRIVASENDLEKIKEEIEKIFVIDATKVHRKKPNNQYNAVHQMLHMHSRYIVAKDLEEATLPEVEVQYWSEELGNKCFRGEMSYAIYKHKSIAKLLKQLEENPEKVYKALPVCYQIQGNEVKRLSAEETLIKMYPELKKVEKGLDER